MGWYLPYPSRPAPRPIQPTFQWLPVALPAVKWSGFGVLQPSFLAVMLSMGGGMPLLPLWAFMAGSKATFTFTSKRPICAGFLHQSYTCTSCFSYQLYRSLSYCCPGLSEQIIQVSIMRHSGCSFISFFLGPASVPITSFSGFFGRNKSPIFSGHRTKHIA